MTVSFVSTPTRLENVLIIHRKVDTDEHFYKLFLLLLFFFKLLEARLGN